MTTAARTIAHLIRTDDEYDAVVAEMETLLDKNPRRGSPVDERIEFLSVLIAHYDESHHRLPGPSPTPQQVLSVVLQQRGMKRSDLTTLMGGRSRVSEFFKGTRPLSMSQVVKLRALLGIPADLLVGGPDEQVVSIEHGRQPKSRARRPATTGVKRRGLCAAQSPNRVCRPPEGATPRTRTPRSGRRL